MTDSQSSLLSATQDYVTDLFLTKVSKSVIYHNLEHTQSVVTASGEMADYYRLNHEDRQALLLAAWFHDTGFSKGESKGHEAESVRLAEIFLSEHNADVNTIQKVKTAIEATKMPQSPGYLIEQILCDADLFHLGTDEFWKKNEQLRQELIGFSNQDLSKKQWRKLNIAFLENHTYFTDYGRRKLQPVKEQHIAELKSNTGKDKDEKEGKEGKEKKRKKNKRGDDLIATYTDIKNDSEEKKKKDKVNQTERGTSTVFRIMAGNHSNLSQMADSKAHIMISVNSIILSIVISVLIRHLDENPNLIVPTIMLVLVCVGAIVFAVRATRPNISEGTFTREDIQTKKTNLLFFGNFHNMTLPDYDWAMKEMLGDRDYLYGSMIKDIYFLGVVLAKKYRLLRISYNIFMYGLIITMLVYGAIIAYDAFFVPTSVENVPIVP